MFGFRTRVYHNILPAAKDHIGLGHGLDGTLRFRAIVGADGYLMLPMLGRKTETKAGSPQ